MLLFFRISMKITLIASLSASATLFCVVLVAIDNGGFCCCSHFIQRNICILNVKSNALVARVKFFCSSKKKEDVCVCVHEACTHTHTYTIKRIKSNGTSQSFFACNSINITSDYIPMMPRTYNLSLQCEKCTLNEFCVLCIRN